MKKMMDSTTVIITTTDNRVSFRISPCTSAMVCPGFTPHMAAMDN